MADKLRDRNYYAMWNKPKSDEHHKFLYAQILKAVGDSLNSRNHRRGGEASSKESQARGQRGATPLPGATISVDTEYSCSFQPYLSIGEPCSLI